VGLINSSTGGTAIESWIDAKAQEATPALAPFLKAVREVKVDEVAGNAEHEKKMAEWQEAVKVARKEGKEIPRRPRNAVETMKRKLDIGGRFNGKIAPLVGYTIRGMVWYQGEANAQPDKAGYYEHQMPLLVEDWRKKWGDEFPVILVQLPNFGRGEPWVIVREAVRKTVMKMQDVGIVVTIDVGDPKDVHPKNKQAVGRRVAGWALDRVYSQGLVGESPLVNGATVQGIEVTLRFDNGKRMELKGEGGFELCDSKGNWRPAHAQAVNEIVVVHSDISNPVGVRYAWKDDPAVTLWSAEGLPASPFMLMIGEHEK
jgi:sialate O-acetylesterase